MLRLAFVVLTGLLAGCVAQQASTARNSATSGGTTRDRLAYMHTQEGACDAKLRAGEFPNRVAYRTCHNDAVWSAAVDVGYPYLDILAIKNAALLHLAEQFDKKEIGADQANSRLAEILATFAAAEGARNETARAAQQRQAVQPSQPSSADNTGAWLGLMGIGLGMMAQPQGRPAIITTNCSALGYSLNCTSVTP